MAAQGEILLIGDGRLAAHLARYFGQLGLRHVQWSRRLAAEGRCPELSTLVHAGTRALLAISDRAIEPFVRTHEELSGVPRVHFSGAVVTPLAIGAHPLFSFGGTLYERELYERIPFVVDEGGPPVSAMIPGLPNPSVFIDPQNRARYHALCVLAGNFTTLLWRKFFFELERELGVERQHALPYLESIARAIAGNDALSGPLIRGDEATVQRNLSALRGDPFERVYQSFLDAFKEQGRVAAGLGKDWLA